MKTIATITASLLIICGISWMVALSHQENPGIEKVTKVVTEFLAPEQTAADAKEVDQLFREVDAKYLALAEESAKEGLRLVRPYLKDAATIEAYGKNAEAIRSMAPTEGRWKQIADVLEADIVAIDDYADRTTGSRTRGDSWNKIKDSAPAGILYEMEENLKSLGYAVYEFAPSNPKRPHSRKDIRDDQRYRVLGALERQQIFLDVARAAK